MRTTAERLAEAKRRARELERERQRGRSLGYLVVGLLAFALGVCVTVLCVRLRGHEGDSADEERYDD